jgi:hypothetical protein
MNLRGQFLTDATGAYAFESVMPGYYPGRCLHVHYRVAPVDGPILVTQLYFAGDPRIPSDPFASRPEAAHRIIPLVQDASGFHGTFDLALAVEPAAVDDPEDLVPTATVLHPGFPNPFASGTTVRWSLSRSGGVEVRVFDANGREVRTLVAEEMAAGYHTTRWDGRDGSGRQVPAGIYFARLRSAGIDRVQKLNKIR